MSPRPQFLLQPTGSASESAPGATYALSRRGYHPTPKGPSDDRASRLRSFIGCTQQCAALLITPRPRVGLAPARQTVAFACHGSPGALTQGDAPKATRALFRVLASGRSAPPFGSAILVTKDPKRTWDIERHGISEFLIGDRSHDGDSERLQCGSVPAPQVDRKR